MKELAKGSGGGKERSSRNEVGGKKGRRKRGTHLVVLPDVPDQQHERLVNVDPLLSRSLDARSSKVFRQLSSLCSSFRSKRKQTRKTKGRVSFSSSRPFVAPPLLVVIDPPPPFLETQLPARFYSSR